MEKQIETLASEINKGLEGEGVKLLDKKGHAADDWDMEYGDTWVQYGEKWDGIGAKPDLEKGEEKKEHKDREHIEEAFKRELAEEIIHRCERSYMCRQLQWARTTVIAFARISVHPVSWRPSYLLCARLWCASSVCAACRDFMQAGGVRENATLV